MRDKRFDKRPTEPHELLLIRAGHHLWREYKATRSGKPQGWQLAVLDNALQTVWDAKEAVRVELRLKWLESSKNRSRTLVPKQKGGADAK